MSIVLWAVLALVAGLLVIAVESRRVLRPRQPLDLPPGETLPPTALQVMARRAIALGLLPIAAAAGLVAWAGVDRFYDDDPLRLTVTLLLLAALLVLAGFAMLVGGWVRRGAGPLDERDRDLFAKAPGLEGVPMLVTLAVWVVGLQEAFWREGAVPLVYLYLVFWSMILVKSLALPIGVLAGYRRS